MNRLGSSVTMPEENDAPSKPGTKHLGGFRTLCRGDERHCSVSSSSPSCSLRGHIVRLPAPHVAEPQPIGKLLSNPGVTIQQQCLTSHIAPCRKAEINSHVNTDVTPDSEINRKSGVLLTHTHA